MRYPCSPLRLSASHRRSHHASLPLLSCNIDLLPGGQAHDRQKQQLRSSRSAAHVACSSISSDTNNTTTYNHNNLRRLVARRSRHNWSQLAHQARTPLLSTTIAAANTTIMSSTSTSLNPAQARGHMGHSHGHGHHHHHHDSTFLTSTDKNDPGVKITRIGLYVNLGMAIAKAAGGYAFNSQALTADAVHSLTDLISDFTTLATISYSIRSPTTRFPLGYGKIESLGALGVSGLLLSGGIMIGLQAVVALCQQFFPDLAHIMHDLGLFGHGHGHSHSHGAEDFGPNVNAAWLAGGSILIKEWLYRATMKVAKEKRSSVLASNAYHHRVDSLTAFVALATICASHLLPNAAWLDPVGGLIISGMIVQAGYGNTKLALLELADVSVDEEIRSSAEAAARRALSEFEGGDGSFGDDVVVQGIKSGQNFLVEVSISIPGNWTVDQSRAVEDKVRQAIGDDVKGVKRVSVRFATIETEGDAFAREFVTPKKTEGTAAGQEHDDHEHEHEHEHGHSHDSTSSSSQSNVTKRK